MPARKQLELKSSLIGIHVRKRNRVAYFLINICIEAALTQRSAIQLHLHWYWIMHHYGEEMLITSAEGGYVFGSVCLSVCLSVG